MDEFQTRLSNADPFQSWWPIIVAIVVGVAMTIRNFMGGQNSPSTNDINGQIVIITGGSGIGLEITKELCSRGAHVIVASRDMKKAEEGLASVKKQQPSACVEIRYLDLQSFDCVKRFAKSVAKDFEKVDVLINNAGIIFNPYEKTVDRFESHLQVQKTVELDHEINDRFPYYKSNDDRWKNSVRHNLSINPHFRKGIKAAQGAGHLWTISTRDSESNVLAWEHKKQRFDLFFKMEKSYSLSVHQTQPQQSQSDCSNKGHIYDVAAIAAGNLLLINKQSSSEPNKSYNQQKNQQNSFEGLNSSNTDDLKRSAGEILNGVRRTVEVQVINPPSCLYQDNAVIDTDYLNPVPKDQIVRECGLRTVRNENDFYVTDIDPIELGVHMNSSGDDEVLFGDEFNLNYFGVVSGNNIMA